MAKTITLTDKQAQDWLNLLKVELMQPGLAYDYATRINQLVMQIEGTNEPFFLANFSAANFDTTSADSACNKCSMVDPEVVFGFYGWRCPLHRPTKEREAIYQTLYDLYQVGDLAALYMPGELADRPEMVMDALAKAKRILVEQGLLAKGVQ